MLKQFCLSTIDLTTTFIKNALETVSFLDVEEWETEVFGRSTLSKRQILFSTEHEDTKTV
jgi:hypothetical protein